MRLGWGKGGVSPYIRRFKGWGESRDRPGGGLGRGYSWDDMRGRYWEEG